MSVWTWAAASFRHQTCLNYSGKKDSKEFGPLNKLILFIPASNYVNSISFQFSGRKLIEIEDWFAGMPRFNSAFALRFDLFLLHFNLIHRATKAAFSNWKKPNQTRKSSRMKLLLLLVLFHATSSASYS